MSPLDLGMASEFLPINFLKNGATLFGIDEYVRFDIQVEQLGIGLIAQHLGQCRIDHKYPSAIIGAKDSVRSALDDGCVLLLGHSQVALREIQVTLGLTQVTLRLTQITPGLTQVTLGLTQVTLGLTQITLGLTQVTLRLTQITLRMTQVTLCLSALRALRCVFQCAR